MASRINVFATKAINVAWGQIFLAIVAVGSIRIYTELLDPSEFGAAMLGMGIATLLDGILIMALSQTLAYFCSRLTSTHDREVVAASFSMWLIRKYVRILPGISIIGTLVSSLFWDGYLYVLVLGLLSAVYLIAETARASMVTLLNVNQQQSRFSVWTVVEALLQLLIVGAALHLAQATAFTYIFALVLAKVISTIAFACLFYGRSFFRSESGTRFAHLKAEATSYAIPFSGMAILGWLGTTLDRFLLGHATPLSVVGIYTGASATIGKPYAVVTATLSNYFRPMLFEAEAMGLRRRADRIFRVWTVLALLIGIGGMALTILLGPSLLPLVLAESYRDGALPIMLVLSIGLTATIVTHAFDNTILAQGSSRRLVWPQLVAILVGVSSMAVLAFHFGAMGAAIGRVIGDMTKLVLTVALRFSLMNESAAAVTS